MLPDLRGLTPRDAIELLERAVAEKGEDYVYRPDRRETDLCFYADYDDESAYYEFESVGEPTGPGCIVGHVLSYLGATPEDLAALDLQQPTATMVCENLSANADVIGILRAAQNTQDGLWENAWGQALESARRSL